MDSDELAKRALGATTELAVLQTAASLYRDSVNRLMTTMPSGKSLGEQPLFALQAACAREAVSLHRLCVEELARGNNFGRESER